MSKIISVEHIEHSIFIIRGQKVMIDSDLASLYGVETKTFNQAVKRNLKRFPPDFMFRLTRGEAEKLRSRSQIVTLNEDETKANSLRLQIATLKRGENIKYLPYVFTEFGVAMLSSVLRSERAILVNIEIMRTFGRLRQMLASHVELAEKLRELEKKYDESFRVVFEVIERLTERPDESQDEPPKELIGFRP